MGFFSRIGQKFRSGVRIGQKFLGNVGRVGTKVASAVEGAYNAASGFPIIGHALKSNPLVQGLRGVVGGVGAMAKLATGASQVLEKGTYDKKTAKDLYSKGSDFVKQAKSTGGDAAHLFNKGNKETNQGHTHHG